MIIKGMLHFGNKQRKKEIKNEPLVGCMNDYNGIFYTTVNTIILELKLPYIYVYIYIYIYINFKLQSKRFSLISIFQVTATNANIMIKPNWTHTQMLLSSGLIVVLYIKPVYIMLEDTYFSI